MFDWIPNLPVVWIALAGPAASLCGLCVTASLFSTAAGAGVVHGLLWAATLTGVGAVVLNLVPFELRDRDGLTTFRSDGRVLLDALRALRLASN